MKIQNILILPLILLTGCANITNNIGNNSNIANHEQNTDKNNQQRCKIVDSSNSKNKNPDTANLDNIRARATIMRLATNGRESQRQFYQDILDKCE